MNGTGVRMAAAGSLLPVIRPGGTALLWALLMLRWVVALDVPAGLLC